MIRSRLAVLTTSAFMLAGCTATTTAPPRTESAAIPQQDDPETSDVAEDEEPPGFIEICVSKKTRVRVSYRGCDDTRPGVTWYFLPLDAKVPATGSKAKRGSFKQPRGDSYRAPAKGGIGSDVMLADVDDRVEVCVLKKTRTCPVTAGGPADHQSLMEPTNIAPAIPAKKRQNRISTTRPPPVSSP